MPLPAFLLLLAAVWQWSVRLRLVWSVLIVIFIVRVIEEELRGLEDVPPITPYLAVQVRSEHEQKVVTQLAKMIKIVGDEVKNHQEFQE